MEYLNTSFKVRAKELCQILIKNKATKEFKF